MLLGKSKGIVLVGILVLTVIILTLTVTLIPNLTTRVEGSGNLNENPAKENLQKAGEIFVTGEDPNNLTLFITSKEITLYYDNPEEVSLPVFALNRTKATKIGLKELIVTDESKKIRAKLTPDKDLEGTLDIVSTKDQVLVTLLEPDTPKYKDLLKKGYLAPSVPVSLKDLALKDGDSLKLYTTVTYEAEKKTFSATTETLFTIASLPIRSGWQGGDGHVHTSWSPDVVGISIYDRAVYAANNGFKWLVITDHSDGIGNNWQTYISQCNQAQQGQGILVAPGAEITAAELVGYDDRGNPIYDYGDCLAYWLCTAKTSIPPNKTYSHQQLITEINNHNPGKSYAVIAHPYGSPTWKYWTVSGFRAMELLSNERQASTSTINKWFELLRAGLANTISGGRFVVGIGCTDAHNLFYAPGDRGFSWVYATDYTPTNRDAIWSAIRMGRVSASGRKDLGVFSLNGFAQGSVVQVTGSNNLTFRLIQQPVSGRTCTQITIRNSNNTVIHTVTNPTATETIWTTSPPSTDTFYVVKFVFKKTDNTDDSDVWTNPIFVDRI